MSAVIILGSSRSDGGTQAMVAQLAALSHWDLIDLNDYSFSYFDYEHRNRNDDFFPLISGLIEKYDTFVFVTPVYWYAMSGIMKVFFDRISDLLIIEKPTGRKLRGKKMAVVSCSIGNNLGDHFWLPFRMTAGYLGMSYLTNAHLVEGRDAENEQALRAFVETVQAADPGSPKTT